mmetsp:Transcript_39414/g.95368  ORF Transcript_39414/g.95368 Transcript_39414/m.95368 type:complete len:374 (+) Transcript_39414:104-1225(+)
MTVGVDDVSEKLNGLVNLLQIVGIDGVDPNALVEEQKRLASGKKDGSSAGTGTTAQSTDSQILEIIKKLQLAQADSPEILQALKSPELLALASLAAQTKAPAPAPSLEDVMEDEDDNYPKIGPGYSDEISVVSEMSTPTVMTKQNVNEEEYYSEVSGAPPPMSIGGRPPTSIGGAGRGKSRNLLTSVGAAASRGALAKGGGAAAQRRANYQNTMAKLQEPEKEEKKPKSQKGKGKKSSDKKKKKKDHDDKSKSSKGSKGDGIDWGTSGDDAGWPSFETSFGEDPFGTTSGNTETVVDSDGFFTSDVFANVDPFSQQASAPAASSNSSTASSTKKDGKKKKPKKPKDDGQGTRNRTEKPKERTKNRRRRASMGM